MKRFFIFLFLVLAVSCVKASKDDLPESRIEVNAEISQSSLTKAIHEGTSFKTGNTIGIFVYHSETEDVANPSPMSGYVLYGERYKNIRATFDERNRAKPWKFNFENATTVFDDIYLLRPTVSAFETGLAVVAYAPFIENVSSITEIPFTLGGKSEGIRDLLWARQNTHDASVNPIDPGKNYKVIPDGNVQPVDFTFQHALSLLRIGFRCKYDGSLITLTSITLKKKDGGQTSLPISGKFNAMTGGVENVALTNSLTYDYTDKAYAFQSTTDYVYVPMLICPQAYLADGDYLLEFELNGEKLQSSYGIKLSDVAGGFKAGEVYTFNFTVDNYVQFDGVTVSTEWIELDVNKKELKF